MEFVSKSPAYDDGRMIRLYPSPESRFSDENQNHGILLRRIIPIHIETTTHHSANLNSLHFFNPQRISAVDPTILFTKKNSKARREAVNEGGEAIAKNKGFSTSGTRSWRYWPGRV
ncbi:hypothetical protein F2Q68_00011814 [Brassica cretica]|uniref:Uncharacterized protein n=1 Tax=Brassica cretica TaxID=69181 RepID=A0A8S9KPA8_BRACR|nr:hypothetical protein F2Q68_00011814 [Brassica cretica]